MAFECFNFGNTSLLSLVSSCTLQSYLFVVVIYQLSDLVVRVSALRLGGQGSVPWPGHTKD